MCNFNRMNETVLADAGPDSCYPPHVDWYGFDIYSFDSSSYKDSRRAFEENVIPHLSHGGQSIVPTSTGFAGRGNNPVYANWTLDQFDDSCASLSDLFFDWATKEDRVAGIFPWHWPTYPPGSLDDSIDIGLNQMPKCTARYQMVAEEVRRRTHGHPPEGGQVRPPVHTECRSQFVTDYSWCARV